MPSPPNVLGTAHATVSISTVRFLTVLMLTVAGAPPTGTPSLFPSFAGPHIWPNRVLMPGSQAPGTPTFGQNRPLKGSQDHLGIEEKIRLVHPVFFFWDLADDPNHSA